MRSSLVLRVRVICAFFIVAAILLVVRLYFVQIVHGAEYKKDAIGQYVESSPDTEARGNIYFTAKDGTLVAGAVMQTGWRLAIRPADILDVETTYRTLNTIPPVDREPYDQSIAKKDDPYEEIAFRVPEDAGVKIRDAKLDGVLLVQDQWRAYPAGTLASQTLGFVGFKGNTKTGVYGLEREWQATPAKSSSGHYINPFAEIFTNVGALISSDPAAHEGSIITSIEPSVQLELEKTLDNVMKTYSPHTVGGIVMDPSTGEIVAMGARPAFDPNIYNTVTNAAVFSNPLVEGRYEMGSIMKPLTVAIGVDAGAITPETTYNDTGCTTRSGKKICNYDLKARNVVSMQEVLNQSLNLGVTFIVDRTGHEIFTRYMRQLAFDQKTEIDVPNEVLGDISPLGNGEKPEVNYAAASFGQGISVTPIAMIRALSVLANGGKLPNPHVVTGIRYESGITRSISATSSVQVLKPETVTIVSNMLVKVYDKALLGGVLKQEHYSIAAKTGTAQIAEPGSGYYSDRFLHSFFGYLPAHEPKYIVFLFAIEPHGAEFASATLARPFAGLAEYLVNYYDIPPDR